MDGICNIEKGLVWDITGSVTILEAVV